ncbi:MAG: 1-(5-phosphoribosyl)-5-((5-phosphoribosylamino)methylideneamino)imidazole-4-carboxamide isomerase [Haliea sp.]|nr:1-(5-phosphoribosyl)-5-((5-phosphoribosylamino)methylideneamino)imidazole-4-carboxamide isomerase [Haliea sp.]MAL95203.1 1-(5-phosphoribosyl)-5-((5-phosphoribosylamino)methylideneamino)imidazole-4-carboxamide isomerase [Haliea sp.]|tara:strand:+ start:4105 stop:4497 length:393 start_codon:yes stop_codon:yes gene_type:complete
MAEQSAAPTGVHLHRKSRLLELTWEDGSRYQLPCEYLRVYSPSAEVKGHGPGQEVLQTGKLNVAITDIKPVGHYALQLVFDDGHDTGLYGWDYLRQLCREQEQRWDDYLRRLHEAGASRDPQVQVVKFQP